MNHHVEKVRSGGSRSAEVRWLVTSALLVCGLASVGLVSAQVPSSDPPPFIEAEIEIEAEVDGASGRTTVRGKINIDSDGLGSVLDAVVGALCRIFPCGGGDDDDATQALLRTEDATIGDGRTGIILDGGAVGIGAFFSGIAVEESAYEWGFSIRFARDSDVKIRSMTFTRDAFLTEAYLKQVGMEGPYYVPAGTYWVLDGKLTVPVVQRR
jgi:hypothetical protein